MGFLDDFVTIVADTAAATAKHLHFMRFLRMPRPEAQQLLTQLVSHYSPQQLDAFEAQFISFVGGLYEPAQRIRATELYAWLKLEEYARYQQWRGFVGSGEPLP